MKSVYFLLTNDCDLRIGDNAVQKSAMTELFRLYDGLGLRGRTTWFVNEIDFNFTMEKADLLLEIMERGDAIGIHDHYDSNGATDYESAKRLSSRSLNSLSWFLASNGINRQIFAHRNGCAHQFPHIYKALIELGYKVVSDVWPENKWYSTMIPVDRGRNIWSVKDTEEEGGILTDNSHVPLDGAFWFHDEENPTDYLSDHGALIQLPVACIGGPAMDKEATRKCIENSRWREAFVVWDVHPYDIQDEISLKIEKSKLSRYQKDIMWAIDEYDPVFVDIDDFYFNRILKQSKLFTVSNPVLRKDEPSTRS